MEVESYQLVCRFIPKLKKQVADRAPIAMSRCYMQPQARAPLKTSLHISCKLQRPGISVARATAPQSSAGMSKRSWLGLLGGIWLSSRGLATAATMTAEQVVALDHLCRLALVGSIVLYNGGLTAAANMIEQVLQDPRWPEEFPFRQEAFERYDESKDTFFYDQPRFVTHIDDGAINALTKYYQESFPPSGKQDVAVLDLCSSWISHYPQGYTAGRIAGLGMNEQELKKNKVLTEYAVRDLNDNPMLPYEDESFDVITNAVSVDYLNKPIEIFREMHRVLKPGGQAIMSFSNRCFPTKAISIWTSTGDLDHVWIVGSYFHYSVPGGWTPPAAKDISPGPGLFGGKGDPMYVVFARKQAA